MVPCRPQFNPKTDHELERIDSKFLTVLAAIEEHHEVGEKPSPPRFAFGSPQDTWNCRTSTQGESQDLPEPLASMEPSLAVVGLWVRMP
jgi:hypothetical protein